MKENYRVLNRFVSKRNKVLRIKRVEFVNESIERFPSLEKKFYQWFNSFRSKDKITYKPSSFEYYYFVKFRMIYLMRYYGVKFLKKELGYGRYRTKFYHYQGCLFQLEHMKNTIGFQTEEVTNYNLYLKFQRGLSRFLKLPKNIFQIETIKN